MNPKYDLTGRTFGRLTVLRQVPSVAAGDGRQWHRAWAVRCSCGTEKVVKGNDLRRVERTTGNGGTRSCGCLRREVSRELSKRTGEGARNWRGGTSKTSQGYLRLSRVVLVDGTERIHYYQHRDVMEKHLGRRLLPGENVHHKNGRRDDNRIENLELWMDFQPSGQRVEDHVAYAKEILRRYEPSSLRESPS